MVVHGGHEVGHDEFCVDVREDGYVGVHDYGHVHGQDDDNQQCHNGSHSVIVKIVMRIVMSVVMMMAMVMVVIIVRQVVLWFGHYDCHGAWSR